MSEWVNEDTKNRLNSVTTYKEIVEHMNISVTGKIEIEKKTLLLRLQSLAKIQDKTLT